MDAFPYAEQLAREKPNLPLAGVKVIDLSRLLPGPYATMLLGDLGADVLKVEDPQLGDYLRWRGPFVNGESASFLVLNRNKRSMTLNLKHAAGREIFIKLAQQADVVVESFRPGVMEKLGVGYPQLKEINPRLIYCAISGYGQTGPYVNRPGHDLNYVGFAGALGQGGRAGQGPALPGVQIADLAGGGMLSIIGILSALEGRHRTGEGRFVDISMTDGVASWLTYMAGDYFASGEPQKRGEGRLNGSLPEYNVYETADGKWLTVGALEEKFFERLCDLIELPQYKKDVDSKGARNEEIKAAFTTRFKQKTRAEWLALLGNEDVCVGPVYELDEVFEDPQLLNRGLVAEMEHPKAGRIKQLGLPVKLDNLPEEDVMRVPSPSFGEQTTAVLEALGYSTSDIARFKQEKAI
jgi:crotonobetainyl-CoA:carnitine CoA-transferase CaiB-like acyl-CoA transferase